MSFVFGRKPFLVSIGGVVSRSKLSVAYVAMVLVVASMAFAQTTSSKPAITSVSPTSATAGGATLTLTVTGSSFVRGAAVLWTGAALTTTFVSSTRLMATVPSALLVAAGTFQITVYVAGRSGGTSNAVSFTINPAPTTTTASPLAIITTSVPTGTTGTSYGTTLAASGGTAPYSWSVSSGALPPGLTLSTPGAISGTPTTSGSYAFTAQVKDSASGVATYTYSTSTATGTTLAFSITTGSLPIGTASTAYSTTLAAHGGASPYSWRVAVGSTLPAGLALSTAGALSGTPTTVGTYSFQVQAKDSAGNTATHIYSCTVAAATTGGGGVIPATLFGMHLINKSNWPAVSIAALGAGTATGWPYVEQTKGVFDWNNLDAWVNEAQSHGLGYFFSPEKVPPWAAADLSTCAPTYAGSSVIGCMSRVTNIQDWDDYVKALVARYKGRIQIYELWNEPDDLSTFSGTKADMAALTTHMYNIIRSIDPHAIILSPSPCCLDSYMDGYFAAGGPTGVDGISLHAYNPSPEKVIDYVNNIKQIAAKYGLASKPLWDTEGSWGTASLTSDAQVAAVARFYLLLWSNGVSRFYWYAWDSGTWGPLWDATNGPHPAALAYQQVYNWMVGATMASPCSVDATSTWTCGLSRPGGYQAQAMWNTTSTMSYTPPSRFTRYSDLAGNVFPITGGSVMIGAKPILLETQAR